MKINVQVILVILQIVYVNKHHCNRERFRSCIPAMEYISVNGFDILNSTNNNDNNLVVISV